MEEPELPGLLVDEVGGILGILEAHLPFLKKHFHLITMKELLENKACLGVKVEAIYVWWHKPVIDRELLKSLPNLKVVANSGAGMDHLDLKLLAGFGVRMANAPHAVRSSTADTGVALLLAAARRLIEGCQVATSPDTECFPCNMLGDDLTGATLGIIGMGSIGYKIALRAKAFEMKILYHNRNRRDHPLLKLRSVILTPHLGPRTHKTARMITEEATENILAALHGLPMPNEVFP